MANGPERWEEIRSTRSGELVLAIGWPSAEQGGPHFADLIPLLGSRYPVWRIAGQSGPTDWDTSIEKYAGPWVQEIRDSVSTVRAVLAHGLGGILAAVISEMVGQWQGYFPEVLLIDPELVDTDLVYDEFLSLLPDVPATAAGSADAADAVGAEVKRLRERGAELTAASGGDAAALAADLYALLRDAGARIRTPEPGVPAAENALARAESRLSELAIADRADVIRLWDRGTALCSSSRERGLSRTRAALLLPEAALVGREITFDIDHEGILKDAAVARTVYELIGA
ncbi:hypothetical protein [Streptomyces sp. NBC_00370]|uniref:hypothetical protein n=1 Tax=Streptomyces sp. NBC_00370 TaxID=2975728 RepID=UPI002E26A203